MLKKTIGWSTVLIAVLAATAALTGLLDGRIYAREALTWAMEGMGQDLVTMIIVIPAFVISGYLAARGSIRALLVWLGLLIYFIYSYILYAFFIHFGPLFLVYTAILGLSVYAMIVSLYNIEPTRIAASFGARTPINLLSWFLYAFVALFTVLWLADIAQGLTSTTFPENIADLGLPVNPVEVLDLGLYFPGVAITAHLLKKKHPLGYLFTAPVLVFGVFMGLAVIGMSVTMTLKGISFAVAPVITMGLTALASLGMVILFLKGIGGVAKA
jgi:hypothetical protein